MWKTALLSRNRAHKIAAITLILAAALSTTLLVYVSTTFGSNRQDCNLLVGCGPIPYPAIQSAHAQVGSYAATNCQLTSNDAVCPVYIDTGAAGNVTLTVINKDQQSWQGSSRAQFLVYSSDAQDINFTSIPTCAYTSAPSFNSPSCPVGFYCPSCPVGFYCPSCPVAKQAQTFVFDFTVSPNYVPPPPYVARQPASITVVIYKTCCWP